MTVVEVKGEYRLHSHGRARTAFNECAAAFPDIVFAWVTRDKTNASGWTWEYQNLYRGKTMANMRPVINEAKEEAQEQP